MGVRRTPSTRIDLPQTMIGSTLRLAVCVEVNHADLRGGYYFACLPAHKAATIPTLPFLAMDAAGNCRIARRRARFWGQFPHTLQLPSDSARWFSESVGTGFPQ